MIFLLYTRTSALIIYISNIKRIQKYSVLALNCLFSIIISKVLTMNIAEYAFSWQSEFSRVSLTVRIEKVLRAV